jgi:glutamine cyclotransferase
LTYDTDRNELVATDGSDKMLFIDPSTLKIVRTCSVRLSHNGASSVSVRYMNELEYMAGLIFANIYIPAGTKQSTNFIVAINPVTCHVEHVIPFNTHAGAPGNPEHVMNGIAKWGSTPNQFLVTGKMWNKIFLIETSNSFEPQSLDDNITMSLSRDLEFR